MSKVGLDGVWERRIPAMDPEPHGALAMALCEGDEAKALELLNAGDPGWHTRRQGVSDVFTDVFANMMMRPHMGHWLAESAPWALSGWMRIMSEREGASKLALALNDMSSARPDNFGRYSVLALALKGAQIDVAMALMQSRSPDIEPWLGLVDDLLARGANPSLGDSKDRSCFCFLPKSLEEARPLGQRLLAAGGDPRAGLDRGKSFLEEASSEGISAWVKLALLEWGLGSDSGLGRPDALRWACSSARGLEKLDREAFVALLDASGDIFAADLQRLSPLDHVAALAGSQGQSARSEKAMILMERGADPAAPAGDGLSPMDRARLTGNAEMGAQMLAWIERRELGSEAPKAPSRASMKL